jgi:hypothetical protein
VSLDVVLVLQGGVELETILHRRFAEYRRHGEWFALPDGWQGVARSVAPHIVEVVPSVALERVYFRTPPRRLTNTRNVGSARQVDFQKGPLRGHG